MQTKSKFIIAASAALICASAAHAQSAGSFLLNAGWTYVVPKKSTVDFNEEGRTAHVKTQNVSAFGLSGTYFITDNFAGELALSTPARISLKNGDDKVGSVKQFSPALLLKYYFLNAEDKFRPYVGVGVSRVSFKDAQSNDKNIDFDFKNKWAPVANAGFTYQFTDQLFGGVSVSYTQLDAGNVTFRGKKDDENHRVYSTGKLKLNPITTFVSLGYKF